ncbi:MAG: hypothetical protein ACMXYA_03505 [Candidatus Woesearchaeota archaeon]
MSKTLSHKTELKEFIIKTVSEMTERIVPVISEDEESEIQTLYGRKIYDNDYDKNNCIKL